MHVICMAESRSLAKSRLLVFLFVLNFDIRQVIHP